MQFRRTGFSPSVEKMSWRREWLPIPVVFPGKFHGQRSVAGYSLSVAKSWTQLSDCHFQNGITSIHLLLAYSFIFLINFSGHFTILCQFLLYRKVNQLHLHIYPLFKIVFPYGSLQSTEQSFLFVQDYMSLQLKNYIFFRQHIVSFLFYIF